MNFMIIGLPRSGTTWAANWLTTDLTHCYHDPLYTAHYTDWDSLSIPGRETGVSCTGIWRWADWVNSQECPKVIIHRDVGDVIRSMREVGMPPVFEGDADSLNRIIGLHVPFSDLFDENAQGIWEHLVITPFNRERHQELAMIEMQPQFSGLKVGRDVTLRLQAELCG